MYLLSRGSGFPVLFIHGIPTSNHLWNAVVDKLLGRFSCLAIDLPGLGAGSGGRGASQLPCRSGPSVRRCDGCLASSCVRIALVGPNLHGDQDGSGHKSCDQRHDHHHGEQLR